jgi:hypothetical protein
MTVSRKNHESSTGRPAIWRGRRLALVSRGDAPSSPIWDTKIILRAFDPIGG